MSSARSISVVVRVEMLLVRPTAIVFPASPAGLRIPDCGVATTAKSSFVQDPAGAITLMFRAPRAWAPKNET